VLVICQHGGWPRQQLVSRSVDVHLDFVELLDHQGGDRRCNRNALLVELGLDFPDYGLPKSTNCLLGRLYGRSCLGDCVVELLVTFLQIVLGLLDGDGGRLGKCLDLDVGGEVEV
jgi:hypothetical protein